MKCLPNKKLSEKEILASLLRGKLYGGAEACICESDKEYSVYKIFAENGVILPMGDNKEKKINLLYERDLDYTTKILSTLSYNGEIVGYEMLYDEDLISVPSYNLIFNTKDVIYFLKKTKDILEYFKDKDLLYGDVAVRNILFNRKTGEIVFCDIDNVQLDQYKMDILPFDLFDYRDRRGIDYGVHPYMHNKMLLGLFGYDEFCTDARLFRKYLKFGAKNVIVSMIKPEEFDERYLVDYIRKLK